MKIIIIVAMTADRVIGKDGRLPWHVPEDLKFFKRTTQGHAVIMGRKTYESMGRPLPRRRNIIITRHAGYRPKVAKSLTQSGDPAIAVLFSPDDEAARRSPDQTCLDVVRTVDDAVELCRRRSEETAFIIGGGQLYASTIDRADELFITTIEGDFPGDTFFPEWNPSDWVRTGPVEADFPAAVRYIRPRS
ncbi:MAG: dihydrofolate reductase [Phycisphaerae bacterium]|nr:dihydrofolate reductase [Phycisphaerae bacterium]